MFGRWPWRDEAMVIRWLYFLYATIQLRGTFFAVGLVSGFVVMHSAGANTFCGKSFHFLDSNPSLKELCVRTWVRSSSLRMLVTGCPSITDLAGFQSLCLYFCTLANSELWNVQICNIAVRICQAWDHNRIIWERSLRLVSSLCIEHFGHQRIQCCQKHSHYRAVDNF